MSSNPDPAIRRVHNRVAQRLFRERNPEYIRGKDRRYRLQNPHQRAFREAKRRAIAKRATPKWANDFFMTEIYDLARLRTKLTGIKWHVDHIVPLKSDVVCGLHCEHNMRVVPAVVNLSKHNTFTEDWYVS